MNYVEGRMPETATILQKNYDLILAILPQVEKFPRSHKFTLGDRISAKLLDLHDSLIEAYYSREKEAALKKANIICEQLRVLVRLCKDLKIIGMDKYGRVSEMIDEVGRMVGGWRKSTAR